MSNSTLADNSALDGGGIYNCGTLTVSNSTLADNSALDGGGIYNCGTLTVSNSTLAGNSANSSGGGIFDGSSCYATLNNTIVANSPSGGTLYPLSGGTFSGGYDLIGDGSDLSSFTHSLQGNPLLAPLGNYGGPTPTMPLLPDSPAIDAGSNALAVNANGDPLTTDQLGQPRIVGSAVDIGACEYQGVEGISASTTYSLSNGNLYNTTTNQVIANNVASFEQGGQGDLCYLENNGQLWFYGDANPVASNVTDFAIDADGAVVYLGQNRVLSSRSQSRSRSTTVHLSSFSNYNQSVPYAPYPSYTEASPVAWNCEYFDTNGAQTFAQWWAMPKSETLVGWLPPTPWYNYFIAPLEIIGAVLVTYFTAGAASPLITIAAGAGDAIVDETINHFAFGTPFSVGSIFTGAVGGAIGAEGDILDAVDDLGDAVGGVVGDIADGLDDIGDTVGDLVDGVVDPDSFVGQALQTSFDKAAGSFLTTGSLGQAANAASLVPGEFGPAGSCQHDLRAERHHVHE